MNKKWQNSSLAFKMGNIGSEITRARHWEKSKDIESRNQALIRALELIDATLTDYRLNQRLKEILYLREVISDLWQGSRFYQVPLVILEKYCLDFAVKARI